MEGYGCGAWGGVWWVPRDVMVHGCDFEEN